MRAKSRLAVTLLSILAVSAVAPAALAQKTKLSLWTHNAGNSLELGAVQKFVKDFNTSQNKYEVVIEAFPQASYNDSVAAAAKAGSLPCILDLDGPTVPNFAWSGYVQPLPLSESVVSQINPSEVGRFNGKVYSVGQYDALLLMISRKSILNKYKIRVPTMAKPWTQDEFMAALKTLKASGDFEYPFDVNAGYTGEWWPYAFSPFLQSFGGDLIDRKTYLSAEKVLNGPQAVAWGKWFGSLFADKYVNPTPANDQGFYQGKVAIWYTGNWTVPDATKKYGSDILFLPNVDFGSGPKVGGASWQWGVSANCKTAQGGFDFINYIMKPQQIATMSAATGLIPATAAGAALTKDYVLGGKYRSFFEMSKRFAVLRPVTPGYLTISSQFEKAGLKIRDGGDVQNALDDAVDAINRNIEDNKGYGFKK